MKSFTIALGLLLAGASSLRAQDTPELQAAAARERADSAREKCASLLEGADGISSVGMAGVSGDYRLLLVARDQVAKTAAQAKLGGETFGGLRILWTIKQPTPEALRSLAPASAPLPEKAPGTSADQTIRPRVTASSVSSPDYPSSEVWPAGWSQPWIVWTHTDRGWEVRRNHFFLWYGTGHKPNRS